MLGGLVWTYSHAASEETKLSIDNDPVKVFRKIYDSMYENLQPETIPHAVLIIADYQYKSAFVADQEINLVACLTELMSQVKFK